MNPNDYCSDRVAKRGTALFYAVFQLTAAKRNAVIAVHAFRQEVLEVVEVVAECSDSALGGAKLQWWRDQIAAAYGGTPQHPAARALRAVVHAFPLPVSQFLAIIDGAEANLTAPRYADFPTLESYCEQIGATTNALTAEILGYQDERALCCARDLGRATVLARIVRNIGQDARRNRIYLPADETARFSVTPADLIHGRHSERFRRLVEYQIDRVERSIASTLTDFPAIDRRSQHPVLALAAIARALLREIRADGCRVLNRRTSLTPLRRLWVAWRAR